VTTAIFFDVDGTLLRFEGGYEDVLAAAFEAELGTVSDTLLSAYDEAFWAAFEGCEPDPVEQGMAAALDAIERDGDPGALAEALLAAEQRYATVPEGARESLAALSENDRLGVLTNGVGEWQEAKLAHHDLLEHVETVVASVDVGAHKPDPEPFEVARERIDAEKYVMVGDSDEDVEGARAAGFVPVRVEYGEEMPDFWATLRAMV
jgi:putative hydrolase of the HAD superfamily